MSDDVPRLDNAVDATNCGTETNKYFKHVRAPRSSSRLLFWLWVREKPGGIAIGIVKGPWMVSLLAVAGAHGDC